MGVREFRKPLRRRVGHLVVTITADGVELRGYRRRSGLVVTWQQIAALSDQARSPLLAVDETTTGAAELLALHADPSAAINTKSKPESVEAAGK